MGAASKTLFGVLGLIATGYILSLCIRTNGVTWTWLDGWGVASFELLASLLVIARAFSNPRERNFCLILGTGMCAWSIGDFAMTIETLNGATPPTVSAANYLWGATYPFAYVGVMMLIRQEARKLRVSHYMDGVMAALAVAALYAAFAFEWTVRESGGDRVGAAVNLVYPVGDLLLFVLVMIGAVLLPRGRRGRWYLMGIGCLVNLAGDISALFPGLVATHAGFVSNTGAWPVSLTLISLSVFLPSTPPEREPEELKPGFTLSGLAAGMALLVVMVSAFHSTSRTALGLAGATLITAGIRFAMTLTQMRALTQERNAQLETAAAAERESRDALSLAVRGYSEFAAKVADGDLTAEVAADANKELKGLSEGLNTMVTGLADISGQVQTGVHEIRVSADEILHAVSRHIESAGRQSDDITQTSSAVSEVRRAAEHTAEKAMDVADRARQSLEVSDEGSKAVQTIAEAMEDIRNKVEGMASDIFTLSERTKQISDITATVSELADRSNLLALNASIEAARAGEHGRGFAVVANEVRRLSEQSKEATAQVERVLAEIQDAMSAAIAASEEGTKVVQEGLLLTGRAGDGIRSLSATIREASAAAEEIAASAQQQSVSMDQIVLAMDHVHEGTNEFMAGAQQSQKAAEGLNELSGKLAALTERYRVGTH